MTQEEAAQLKGEVEGYTKFARAWVTHNQGTDEYAVDVIHDDGTHQKFTKPVAPNPMNGSRFPETVEESVRILEAFFAEYS